MKSANFLTDPPPLRPPMPPAPERDVDPVARHDFNAEARRLRVEAQERAEGMKVEQRERVEAAAAEQVQRILDRIEVKEPEAASLSPPTTPLQGESDETADRKVNHAKPWKGGDQVGHDRSRLKRFKSFEAEPDRVVSLDEAHPAVREARSIFRDSIADSTTSPAYLVSGHNSRKLGAVVEKGPWKGMPIYQLSLEERATCPRSCLQWLNCYGNAMYLARRHDHNDPRFFEALRAEVMTVARKHPNGFVVRLHTLGDFYSMEYLNVWGDLLFDLPNLHIFGFTARREDADDEDSRNLALAIRLLSEALWSRFAIRFSGQAGPEGTVVLDEPTAHRHVVMCPAQTGKTEACATCGLCWAEAARPKTIGFLKHGMKRRGPSASKASQRRAAPTARQSEGAATATEVVALTPSEHTEGMSYRRRYEAGESVPEIAGPFGRKARVAKLILAVGGKLRSKSEAVALHWARQKRVRDDRRAKPAAPSEQGVTA